MIELSGPPGTAEHDAAQAIAAAFERLWPGLGAAPPADASVRIASGVKLAGYRVSDIDIVIAAHFPVPRYIVPKQAFMESSGTAVPGKKIRVRSFITAVEVKGHDASRMQVEAGGVSVRYRDGWKSATDQNDAQKYALLDYLKDLQAGNPWVFRCLVLTGIDALPSLRGRTQPAAGAVAADFDATGFIMAMAGVNGVPVHAGEHAVSSGDHETMARVLSAPIFKPVIATTLDRQRMDRVSSRPILAREIAAKIGTAPIQLRGHGGAGKTMLMLQAAYEAFQLRGLNCLVLTYNHALAADIQRLLALKGIPCGADGAGIEVKTVMSLTSAWLRRLGIIADDEAGLLDNYERYCELANEYIASGAISAGDIAGARKAALDPDAILIDEAQDWPQAEASLIARLYPRERFVLADGISQLVRGNATDWRSAFGGTKPAVEPLETCMRMKSGLAVFANAVARAAGLPWHAVPNPSAAGGRVILSFETYANATSLRERLCKDAHAAGNAPVDLLHCVPASEVILRGNQRVSELGETLTAAGLPIWDGVDPAARRDFARDKDAYRIVQYESCRGLEGWVTVLDGLDAFWERKAYECELAARALPEHDQPASVSQYAAHAAWRWVMIALTRPIDTLCITLRAPDSVVAKALSSIAGEYKDLFEVVD
jgi:hypothetical protein